MNPKINVTMDSAVVGGVVFQFVRSFDDYVVVENGKIVDKFHVSHGDDARRCWAAVIRQAESQEANGWEVSSEGWEAWRRFSEME